MGKPEQKTILLVEDDVIIARQETRAIEQFGYNVVTVNSGEKAVRMALDDENISLVLMDIDLGEGINGTEAAKQILALRSVPIVFLTSHSERNMVEMVRGITRYGYVAKDSGDFVLQSSIEMAFELFEAHKGFVDRDEKYRLLAENTTDVLWIMNPVTGKWIYVSPSVERLHGYTVDEVMGQSMEQAMTPESLVHVRSQLIRGFHEFEENRVSTILGECEAEQICKNGKRIWTEIIARYTANERGETMLIGVTRDITERKRVEESLKESEQRFHTLFQSSPYPVMLIDTDNGCFVEVNDAMIQNSEYSSEELIGKSPVEIGILELDVVERTRKLLAEKGHFSDLEIPIRTKSGRQRVGMATAQIISINKHNYISQTILDITEQKHQQHFLKENEEKLRAITSSVADVILLCDRFGNITFVNHLQPGMTHEQILSATVFDFVPPEQRPTVKSALHAVFNNNETYRYETLGPGPNGTWQTFEVNVTPVRVEQNVVLAVFLAHDITERKLSEERIARLLQEKELLLKEVHHRIKNTMNIMRSILSIQASEAKEPSTRAALKDSEDRMHSMMLLYDKLYRSERFSEIPIKDYLEVLTDEIVAHLPHPSAIEVKKDLDQFQMDSKRLFSIGLIVNELLTNIMKYAFIGRPNGTVFVSAKQTGKHVSIVVNDDGVGIPESFDITTSTSFGLQLVHMLAEQLEGTIRVERDHGTKWTLEFDA